MKLNDKNYIMYLDDMVHCALPYMLYMSQISSVKQS